MLFRSQGNFKFGSRSHFPVLQSDGSSQTLDHVANQVQSKSCTGGTAFQFISKPDETTEYLASLVGGNPRAIVDDRDDDLFII